MDEKMNTERWSSIHQLLRLTNLSFHFSLLTQNRANHNSQGFLHFDILKLLSWAIELETFSKYLHLFCLPIVEVETWNRALYIMRSIYFGMDRYTLRWSFLSFLNVVNVAENDDKSSLNGGSEEKACLSLFFMGTVSMSIGRNICYLKHW